MKTEVLQLNDESVVRAAELIRAGYPVAFPTETVYGLGVSAYSKEGVFRVFEAKGRPSDNPLIVHVGRKEDIEKAARTVTPLAKELIDAFMPGPITVVLDKRADISSAATAGLDTVGVRIPVHEGARKLLIACGVPVAAPSANTSSRPSPTCAEHVLEDIGGKIPMILDGGSCSVGIESTVVDARGEIPIILRQGMITAEDIARVVGEVRLSDGVTDIVRSPGVKYRHYAPKCEAILHVGADAECVNRFVAKKVQEGKIPVVICESAFAKEVKGARVLDIGTGVEYTANFYAALRKAEKLGDFVIVQNRFEGKGAGALYNRATKACSQNFLKA